MVPKTKLDCCEQTRLARHGVQGKTPWKMQQLMRDAGICYVRYMDDFLILAKNRRVFRRAIKRIHQVMRHVQLRLHTEKRFIGRICRGFDFLG